MFSEKNYLLQQWETVDVVGLRNHFYSHLSSHIDIDVPYWI